MNVFDYFFENTSALTKNLVSGNIISGDVDMTMIKAADHYRDLLSTSKAALMVVVLAVAIAGALLVLTGLAIGLMLGGLITAYFAQAGFTYPGMAEIAAAANTTVMPTASSAWPGTPKRCASESGPSKWNAGCRAAEKNSRIRPRPPPRIRVPPSQPATRPLTRK